MWNIERRRKLFLFAANVTGHFFNVPLPAVGEGLGESCQRSDLLNHFLLRHAQKTEQSQGKLRQVKINEDNNTWNPELGTRNSKWDSEEAKENGAQ